MFNLPEYYRTDVKLALKDFIPKDLKPDDKKRIKDAVKEVRLMYQIAGEEIPSVSMMSIGVRQFNFTIWSCRTLRMQHT